MCYVVRVCDDVDVVNVGYGYLVLLCFFLVFFVLFVSLCVCVCGCFVL